MADYRKLRYENLNGETVDLSMPWDTFLYDLGGAGFEYQNNVVQNNYIDHIDLVSVLQQNIPISGSLVFDDSGNSNRSIYQKMERAQRIMNYDQLLNRGTKNKRFGKLYYKNATGQEVYTPALVQSFAFGEIAEEPVKELSVSIVFSRGSNVWINTKPNKTLISLIGTDSSHYHPFSHPWTHGIVYAEGNGSIAAIGGTDFAKTIIRVYGEVANFTLTFASENGTEKHNIIYNDTIGEEEVLVIDNINLIVQKNGENAIQAFDLENGDTPFFSLLPNTNYYINVGSPNLRGSIEVEMYETWVAVP